MSEHYNPVSTYRLQLHKDFTFGQLNGILDYLTELGVATIYASPIFKAFPGSSHGYDGTDPNTVNPEIGTVEELLALSGELRKRNIGWLQDIVPNHLAFHHENNWLMDVLENGHESEYARFFDIDWNHPVNTGRLMVPFLSTQIEEEIQTGNIQISFDNNRQKFYLRYFNNSFPVNTRSVDQLKNLPAKKQESEWLDFDIDPITLKQILDQQYYELCPWFDTDNRINFRRFFTVNGLICLNIQDPQVFTTFHQLIKELVEKKVFQGLRIDHIDGLYDPRGYLDKLKSTMGADCYTVVEKILAKDERLPENWNTEGTTGYDFLAMVNNVFTNTASEKPLSDYYQQLSGSDLSVGELIREKKSFILDNYMNGELDNLTRWYLKNVAPAKNKPEWTQIRKEIADYLISCPVYRFYDGNLPMMERDQHTRDEETKLFYKRCMQFTGPLMAKGVEDTLMYTYQRFIGHNDVGDTPEFFGSATAQFHGQMIERQKLWPMAINTTSTHDTKRGEDARARLNAVTDLWTEWLKLAEQWKTENSSAGEYGAPDDNDRYFIYQTLVATYPVDQDEINKYQDRLAAYFSKAFREGKVNSNWSSPNEDYENAAAFFVKNIFKADHPFGKTFFPFLEKVIDYGMINSLAQLTLKFTCPGIPDIYQGTELWDLSLVDPDNRRPVDYTRRISGLQNRSAIAALWENRKSGVIKLQLTRILLELRKRSPDLFQYGDYIPLETTGEYHQHILAFERTHKKHKTIIVVPLNIAELAESQKKSPLSLNWKDTSVVLKDKDSGSFLELVNEQDIHVGENINVSSLFGRFPLAILQDAKSI